MQDLSAPLFFSHVPKTAGTSLRSLAARFTPAARLSSIREFSLVSPNIEFIKGFREKPLPPLIMGHFSYGVHRFIGAPPRYACVMRDPVQRVVSFYRMNRFRGGLKFADLRKNGTLREFVGNCLTEQTNNHVTRMCAEYRRTPDCSSRIAGFSNVHSTICEGIT